MRNRPDTMYKAVLFVMCAHLSVRSAATVEDVCVLPLNNLEKSVKAGGLYPQTVQNMASTPQLVIGMLPVESSILIANTVQVAIREYLGFDNVELKAVSVAAAPQLLQTGEIHVLMDASPSLFASTPQLFTELVSNEGLWDLGPLGLAYRSGVYLSQSMKVRLIRALVIAAGNRHGSDSSITQQIASMALEQTSWESLVALLQEYRINLGALADAAGGKVFMLGDNAAFPGVWRDWFQHMCTTGNDGRVLFKPLAKIGLNLTCTAVDTGEDGLRETLDRLTCLNGRNDVVVVLPHEYSALKYDTKYKFHRLNLKRFGQSCFTAGECDWPRDVIRKLAWTGLRQSLPRDVVVFLERFTMQPNKLHIIQQLAQQAYLQQVSQMERDSCSSVAATRSLHVDYTQSILSKPVNEAVRAEARLQTGYIRGRQAQDASVSPSASISATPLTAWIAPYLDFEVSNLAAGPDDGNGDRSMSNMLFWNNGTIPNDLPTTSRIRSTSQSLPYPIDLDKVLLLVDQFTLDFNMSITEQQKSGDFRRYKGGEIRLMVDNKVVLRLTDCVASVKVFYPTNDTSSRGSITCIVDTAYSNTTVANFYAIQSTPYPSGSASMLTTPSVTVSTSYSPSGTLSISTTPSDIGTPSGTPFETPSTTSVVTPSRSVGMSLHATGSGTPSRSASATFSASETATFTSTSAVTESSTFTPTMTIEASESPSSSISASHSRSASASETGTFTASASFSGTGSGSVSSSFSATSPPRYMIVELEIYRWVYKPPTNYTVDAYVNTSPSNSPAPQNVRLLRNSNNTPRSLQGGAEASSSGTPSISPLFRPSPSLPLVRFGTVDAWIRLRSPASATPTPTQSATPVQSLSASATVAAPTPTPVLPTSAVDAAVAESAHAIVRSRAACLINRISMDSTRHFLADAVRIERLLPPVGSEIGNFAVLIKGSGFDAIPADSLEIMIGSAECAQPAKIDGNTLSCVVPPGTGAFLNVTIVVGSYALSVRGLFSYTALTVRGVQSLALSSAGAFMQVDTSGYSAPFDSSRRIAQDAVVVASLRGVPEDTTVRCAFFPGEAELVGAHRSLLSSAYLPSDTLSQLTMSKSAVVVIATRINETAIRCAAPFSRTGALSFVVTVDGQSWTSSILLNPTTTVYQNAFQKRTEDYQFSVFNVSRTALNVSTKILPFESTNNVPEMVEPADLGSDSTLKHGTILVMHALQMRVSLQRALLGVNLTNGVNETAASREWTSLVRNELRKVWNAADWIRGMVNRDHRLLRYTRLHVEHVFWPNCSEALSLFGDGSVAKIAFATIQTCQDSATHGAFLPDYQDEGFIFLTSVLLKGYITKALLHNRPVVGIVGPYAYDSVLGHKAATLQTAFAGTPIFSLVNSARLQRAIAWTTSYAHWTENGVDFNEFLQTGLQARAADVIVLNPGVANRLDIPFMTFGVGAGGLLSQDPSNYRLFPNVLRLTPVDVLQGRALSDFIIAFEQRLVAHGLLTLQLVNQGPPVEELSMIVGAAGSVSNATNSTSTGSSINSTATTLQGLSASATWLDIHATAAAYVTIFVDLGVDYATVAWGDTVASQAEIQRMRASQAAIDVFVGFMSAWTGFDKEVIYQEIVTSSVAKDNPTKYYSTSFTDGLSIPLAVVTPNRPPLRIIVIPSTATTTAAIGAILQKTELAIRPPTNKVFVLAAGLARLPLLESAFRSTGLWSATTNGERLLSSVWLAPQSMATYLQGTNTDNYPVFMTADFNVLGSAWKIPPGNTSFTAIEMNDVFAKLRERFADCFFAAELVDSITALLHPLELAMKEARNSLFVASSGFHLADMVRNYAHNAPALAIDSFVRPLTAYAQVGWRSQTTLQSMILEQLTTKGGAVLRDAAISEAATVDVLRSANEVVLQSVNVRRYAPAVTSLRLGTTAAHAYKSACDYSCEKATGAAVLAYNGTSRLFDRSSTVLPATEMLPLASAIFPSPKNIVIGVMLPIEDGVASGVSSSVHAGVEPGLLAAVELAVETLNKHPLVLENTIIDAVVVPVRIRYQRYVTTELGTPRLLRDRELSSTDSFAFSGADPDFDVDYYVSMVQSMANTVFLGTDGRLDRSNLVGVVGMDESARTATLLAALQDIRTAAAFSSVERQVGRGSSVPVVAWGAHAAVLSTPNAKLAKTLQQNAVAKNVNITLDAFLRVSPPDAAGIPGLVSLMLENDWRRVGTISVLNDSLHTTESTLVNTAKVEGIVIQDAFRVTLNADTLRLASSDPSDVSAYHTSVSAQSIAKQLQVFSTQQVMVLFVSVSPMYRCAVLRGVRAAGLVNADRLIIGLQSLLADDDLCQPPSPLAEAYTDDAERESVDMVLDGAVGVASGVGFIPAYRSGDLLSPVTASAAVPNDFTVKLVRKAVEQYQRAYNATLWEHANMIGEISLFNRTAKMHGDLLNIPMFAQQVSRGYDTSVSAYEIAAALYNDTTAMDNVRLRISPRAAGLHDAILALGMGCHVAISRGDNLPPGISATANIVNLIRTGDKSAPVPIGEDPLQRVASALGVDFEGATGRIRFEKGSNDVQLPRMMLVNRRRQDVYDPEESAGARRLAAFGVGAVAAAHTSMLVSFGTFDGNPDLTVDGCAPGYYQSAEDKLCLACPIDTFKPQAGLGQCQACPAQGEFKTTTNGVVGATKIGQCLCPEGYYITPVAEQTGTFDDFPCLPCPPSASCEGLGLTLSTIKNQRGFWRGNSRTVEFDACFSTDACGVSGYVAQRELTAHFNKSVVTTGTPCAVGYEGPLCQICAKSYGRQGSRCAECPNIATIGIAWLFGAALAVNVLFYLIKNAYLLPEGTVIQRRRSQNIRVLLNYLQISAAIALFRAATGENSGGIFSFQSAIASVGLAFTSWECIMNAAVYPVAFQKFALYVVMPGFFIGAAALLTRCQRKKKSSDEGNATDVDKVASMPMGRVLWLAFFTGTFLLYPTLILVVVDVLFCYTVPSDTNGSTSYLRADFSVLCSASALGDISETNGVVYPHQTFVLAAKALAFIYIVGIPLVYLVVLLKRRDSLRLGSGITPLHTSAAKALQQQFAERVFTGEWARTTAKCRASTAPQQLQSMMMGELTRRIALRRTVRKLAITAEVMEKQCPPNRATTKVRPRLAVNPFKLYAHFFQTDPPEDSSDVSKQQPNTRWSRVFRGLLQGMYRYRMIAAGENPSTLPDAFSHPLHVELRQQTFRNVAMTQRSVISHSKTKTSTVKHQPPPKTEPMVRKHANAVYDMLFRRSMRGSLAWNAAMAPSNRTRSGADNVDKLPDNSNKIKEDTPKGPQTTAHSITCWDILMRIGGEVLDTLLCKPRGPAVRRVLRQTTPDFISLNMLELRQMFDKLELAPHPNTIPAGLSIDSAAIAELERSRKRAKIRKGKIEGKSGLTKQKARAQMTANSAADSDDFELSRCDRLVQFEDPNTSKDAHANTELSSRAVAIEAVLCKFTGGGIADVMGKFADKKKRRATAAPPKGSKSATQSRQANTAIEMTKFGLVKPSDPMFVTTGTISSAIEEVQDEPWFVDMLVRSHTQQQFFEECVLLICEYGYTATEAIASTVTHRVNAVIDNQQRFGFLYLEYSEQYSYFEVVNMMRKAALIVAVSLLAAVDSFLQMGVCLLLLSAILTISYWFPQHRNIYVGTNPWQPPSMYRTRMSRYARRGRAIAALDTHLPVEEVQREHNLPPLKLFTTMMSNRWSDIKASSVQDARAVVMAAQPEDVQSHVSVWKWSDLYYLANWPRAFPELISTTQLDLLAIFTCVLNSVLYMIIQQLKRETYDEQKLQSGNAATAAAAAAGLDTSQVAAASASADIQSISTSSTETLENFVFFVNLLMFTLFAIVICADVYQARKMRKAQEEMPVREKRYMDGTHLDFFKEEEEEEEQQPKASFLKRILGCCLRRCRCCKCKCSCSCKRKSSHKDIETKGASNTDASTLEDTNKEDVEEAGAGALPYNNNHDDDEAGADDEDIDGEYYADEYSAEDAGDDDVGTEMHAFTGDEYVDKGSDPQSTRFTTP